MRDRDFTTVPFSLESSEIIDMDEETMVGDLPLTHGSIQLTSMVPGFYKIPIGPRARDAERTYQQLGGSAPPPRTIVTHAAWITLPEAVAELVPEGELAAAMRSMQKALVLASCIHLRCDPGDLDGLEMVESRQVFLYDTQVGGSGLAAKVYEHFPEIWQTGWRVLADCPFCTTHPESRGCPKCVTDEYRMEESINRHGALQVFEAMGVAAMPH